MLHLWRLLSSLHDAHANVGSFNHVFTITVRSALDGLLGPKKRFRVYIGFRI